MIIRELTIVAIHGEGDRQSAGNPETPNVTVVLREGDHQFDMPLLTWGEVEEMKTLAGFDTGPDARGLPKRHWVLGGKLKLTIG
jgi:hypothetical protein